MRKEMKAHSRERLCSSPIRVHTRACVCVFVSYVCVYTSFQSKILWRWNFISRLPAWDVPVCMCVCVHVRVCCRYKQQPNRNSMLILERLGGMDGSVSGDVIWIWRLKGGGWGGEWFFWQNKEGAVRGRKKKRKKSWEECVKSKRKKDGSDFKQRKTDHCVWNLHKNWKTLRKQVHFEMDVHEGYEEDGQKCDPSSNNGSNMSVGKILSKHTNIGRQRGTDLGWRGTLWPGTARGGSVHPRPLRVPAGAAGAFLVLHSAGGVPSGRAAPGWGGPWWSSHTACSNRRTSPDHTLRLASASAEDQRRCVLGRSRVKSFDYICFPKIWVHSTFFILCDLWLL